MATVFRYVHKALEVLAALAPDLATVAGRTRDTRVPEAPCVCPSAAAGIDSPLVSEPSTSPTPISARSENRP